MQYSVWWCWIFWNGVIYLQVYCYNRYLRGYEYREGIRQELRFWRVMLREDIVDNRLKDDVRVYDVDVEIDVDVDVDVDVYYCG